MISSSLLILLAIAGLFSGVLAGFLGIGGGTILVPVLLALGFSPIESVATSSLAIVITSSSGSFQNWRMGHLDFKRVFYIGVPALITAQLGVYLAELFRPDLLLMGFGVLLLVNIYLVNLRKRLIANKRSKERVKEEEEGQKLNPVAAKIFTGSSAGVLAGLFGVGGGVIMVPLQILLLGEPIKVAIQTSLGVIVLTAISACVGHALNGNVLFIPGYLLGTVGLIGAQFSTRMLPKLQDELVSFAFTSMLLLLSVYIFWQASQISY